MTRGYKSAVAQGLPQAGPERRWPARQAGNTDKGRREKRVETATVLFADAITLATLLAVFLRELSRVALEYKKILRIMRRRKPRRR
jgi:hypothetical protein